MRPITIAGLLALTLFTTGCGRDSTIPPPPGFGPRRDARAAEQPRPAGWSKVIAAYGETPDKTRLTALEVGEDAALKHLRERFPHLAWQPSIDYLHNQNIISVGEPELLPQENGRTWYKADVTVRLTASDLQDIQHWDRTERVHGRQLLWGKLLAALIALLSVTAGYARLEELTRGYYSGLLRILYVACIGLVATGLWLVI